MKSKNCGGRFAHSLGRRCFGTFSKFRSAARRKDENTQGANSFADYVANAASLEAYNRQEENPLLSVEALPENASLVDFATFAQDYPERLFPLLAKMRPEFQEFFIEYYILHKAQSFIGETHGCIQTRVWQALRIVEQTIGAFLLLGTAPSEQTIQDILTSVQMEDTPYGSLSHMIFLYAATQSYAEVAKAYHVPTPTIRKVFRPAINLLTEHKDIKAVAVGAFLRNMTHQSSLTKSGISKQSVSRLRRIKTRRFAAPVVEHSALHSFGAVANLNGFPWHMIEIASEHRMAQIYPLLLEQCKKTFGKRPGQIFAPLDAEGNLMYGYIFVRCLPAASVRAIVHTRGLAGVSAHYDGDGKFIQLVTVPSADVEKMIAQTRQPVAPVARIEPTTGMFVKILTGPAANYHGTVVESKKTAVKVQVDFPTGRRFLVRAHPSSILIQNVPSRFRAFWGSTEC